MILKSKRILIFTDSLSLPRQKPELVKHSETWPSLLKEGKGNNYNVTIMAMGGATIRKLYEQSHYYSSFDPDVVIMQCGIVDCAPRALGLIEKEIINSNKYFSAIFRKLAPVSFLRRARNITYTSQKDFANYTLKVLKKYSEARVIWIGIIPADSEYENKIKGIQRNINKYNNLINEQIIKTNNIFIETDDFPNEGVMSDHHHINKCGHEWIYSRLKDLI